LSDFLAKEYKPEAHIIGRGILPVKGKCIVAGSPKSNKSFLMLNVALDLCRGRRLFDASYKTGAPVFPVSKPWRVLYLEMELGEQGLLERLKGSNNRAGLTTGLTADGLEFYIQTRDTAMRLDTKEGRDFIQQVVKTVKPDVTIFDPLAKFHLADENSSQETGALMRVVDHLIEDHGTAAIIVHHIGKQDPDPAKQKRGGDRLRGSSALFADTDTLLEVTRLSSEHTTEPILKLSFELRRGEPIEDIFLQRKRDGSVVCMGEGFTFGGTAEKTEHYRKAKYQDL
jgi:RecA-family ATPase